MSKPVTRTPLVSSGRRRALTRQRSGVWRPSSTTTPGYCHAILAGAHAPRCAGGLSGGLWAQFDAELVSGIDTVLDRVRFDELASGAAAVVTGGGRLDAQSAYGKVFVGAALRGAARRAAALGIPAYAVAGQADLTAEESAAIGLTAVCTASSLSQIEGIGAALARLLNEQTRAAT